jgi:DNA polymerase elongation subunit (family B)
MTNINPYVVSRMEMLITLVYIIRKKIEIVVSVQIITNKMSLQQYSYRLLAFNTYDDQNGDDGPEYTVQMFGLNEKGETASIFVIGYQPYFYIRVADDWDTGKRIAFINQIKEDARAGFDAGITQHAFVEKKKLYGFDGGRTHKFIIIKFKSESSLRRVKNLWYTYTRTKEKILRPGGYEFDGYGTELYEAQIPPLLRLFHVRKISPSGWIALPSSKCTVHKPNKRSTSCTHEYTVNFKHILPLSQKETPVPYKICSFDIEASSSHGDFPLAIKNYRKLAQNMVDEWDAKPDGVPAAEYAQSMIRTAFGCADEPVEGVELVYPKSQIDPKTVAKLALAWCSARPSKNVNEDIGDDDDGDQDDEGAAGNEGQQDMEGGGGFWAPRRNRPQRYKKRGNMVDLLSDDSAERDTKLLEITATLGSMFPELEGDTVTFIGSTFLRYGEEKPYLNHCIAKDTCSEMPHVENAVIESYATEKEVLLGWTDVIQREDPDIIIGYNIFGFDYNFLFDRAKQLGIVREFMKLSRNKGELSVKKDWKTGAMSLEGNTIVLASGQHDLHYAKTTGRLQIDLYNYLRREYQLVKYKLDYVAGYFIGDYVKQLDHEGGGTRFHTKNMTGLEPGNYINLEEEAHSVDQFMDGAKFEVVEVNKTERWFSIAESVEPNMEKKVRWGLAKDDVTPQDIFRMTHEGPDQRAIIAKYCVQDCNLVHHLLRKIDVITGYVEMASLCSVPLDFLVLRGQGIKLTSYIAKKCRDKDTLMPVLPRANSDEGYEGAIVLDPKSNLYLDDPVACVDYGSLYPSSMISENISHDSKVWTKEFDKDGNLIEETGERGKDGSYLYDNLPGYKYVDVEYDTYKWQRKGGNPKAKMEKVKAGTKICRFAQFQEGRGVMPSILEELLAARKATKKQIPLQTDDFMKNVLDKRQLSIKITANSLYGQTGAKTSTFFEKDCAASTTAVGRKLLTYGQRVIEEAYKDRVVDTKDYGQVKTDAEYVYGDTDSVFFKFNLKELDGTPIVGQKALEITIELAQEAGELASKFLKRPHDLEYEKTFLPFCLLSKKRYVGMLYETDPHKCYRKSMGIVLKRRDNAPVVKDVYGGIIDILMKDKDIEKAAEFLNTSLEGLISGDVSMDKLVITKSLRSGYKNPKQIAHKVLADRIGRRDPGNKPSVGDRVAFVYISNPDKRALQGDRIETPDFVKQGTVDIDYGHYITNQIMKPVQQVFALVLEQLAAFRKKKGHTLRKWYAELDKLKETCAENGLEWPAIQSRVETLRNREVKALLFDSFLEKIKSRSRGADGKIRSQSTLFDFF